VLIRLRLTLLYSIILALTLGIFGTALYTIQADSTFNALQKDISQRSDELLRSLVWSLIDPTQMPFYLKPDPPQGDTATPLGDPFSGGEIFPNLREREMVRVLDGQGNMLASPFGADQQALPLSEEGMQALQAGNAVWQTSLVNDENTLIYDRPILVNNQLVFILQVARPLTERNSSLAALSQTLVLASLLTTLLAFVIGWFFVGAALRPIQRITQTAQAIGLESDFTRRVDYRGPNDEVGQLASTFNTMLSRLQEAYQRVSQALKMQRTFVADVSHELRTPLTTVRGNLALLRHNPPLPGADQVDILTDMEEESDRLIRLVNNLLVLARADAHDEGLPGQPPEPVALQPVIAEAVRQARALDARREIVEQAEEVSALADRDVIKQTLLILLDNALKHSSGTITVSAAAESGQAVLRVSDCGPGMEPQVLEHVFERFYRANESSAAPGFGLGLPIARALVERQGGTISIHSQPGHGSVVEVRLNIY
jgi:two-component system OmpR family sensor kinase